MHTADWKEPVWKGYILHDSNYMISQERQNCKAKRSVIAKVWGGINKQNNRGIFRAVKYSVWYHDDEYMSLYICSNTECKILRVHSNVIYGLWMVMMNQCRFISCNKHRVLVGLLVMGEAVCVCGGVSGDIWEIYVVPSQFCCEPKTDLKK